MSSRSHVRVGNKQIRNREGKVYCRRRLGDKGRYTILPPEFQDPILSTTKAEALGKLYPKHEFNWCHNCCFTFTTHSSLCNKQKKPKEVGATELPSWVHAAPAAAAAAALPPDLSLLDLLESDAISSLSGLTITTNAPSTPTTVTPTSAATTPTEVTSTAAMASVATPFTSEKESGDEASHEPEKDSPVGEEEDEDDSDYTPDDENLLYVNAFKDLVSKDWPALHGGAPKQGEEGFRRKVGVVSSCFAFPDPSAKLPVGLGSFQFSPASFRFRGLSLRALQPEYMVPDLLPCSLFCKCGECLTRAGTAPIRGTRAYVGYPVEIIWMTLYRCRACKLEEGKNTSTYPLLDPWIMGQFSLELRLWVGYVAASGKHALVSLRTQQTIASEFANEARFERSCAVARRDLDCYLAETYCLYLCQFNRENACRVNLGLEPLSLPTLHYLLPQNLFRAVTPKLAKRFFSEYFDAREPLVQGSFQVARKETTRFGCDYTFFNGNRVSQDGHTAYLHVMNQHNELVVGKACNSKAVSLALPIFRALKEDALVDIEVISGDNHSQEFPLLSTVFDMAVGINDLMHMEARMYLQLNDNPMRPHAMHGLARCFTFPNPHDVAALKARLLAKLLEREVQERVKDTWALRRDTSVRFLRFPPDEICGKLDTWIVTHNVEGLLKRGAMEALRRLKQNVRLYLTKPELDQWVNVGTTALPRWRKIGGTQTSSVESFHHKANKSDIAQYASPLAHRIYVWIMYCWNRSQRLNLRQLKLGGVLDPAQMNIVLALEHVAGVAQDSNSPHEHARVLEVFTEKSRYQGIGLDMQGATTKAHEAFLRYKAEEDFTPVRANLAVFEAAKGFSGEASIALMPGKPLSDEGKRLLRTLLGLGMYFKSPARVTMQAAERGRDYLTPFWQLVRNQTVNKVVEVDWLTEAFNVVGCACMAAVEQAKKLNVVPEVFVYAGESFNALDVFPSSKPHIVDFLTHYANGVCRNIMNVPAPVVETREGCATEGTSPEALLPAAGPAATFSTVDMVVPSATAGSLPATTAPRPSPKPKAVPKPATKAVVSKLAVAKPKAVPKPKEDSGEGTNKAPRVAFQCPSCLADSHLSSSSCPFYRFANDARRPPVKRVQVKGVRTTALNAHKAEWLALSAEERKKYES
jgi:hypothetical protein